MKFRICKSVLRNTGIPLILSAVVFFIFGCSKSIEVDPPDTKVTAASVYNDDATATAVLTGIYAQMSLINYGNNPNITNLPMWTGLSGDELNEWTGATSEQDAFYKNALSVNTEALSFGIIYTH